MKLIDIAIFGRFLTIFGQISSQNNWQRFRFVYISIFVSCFELMENWKNWASRKHFFCQILCLQTLTKWSYFVIWRMNQTTIRFGNHFCKRCTDKLSHDQKTLWSKRFQNTLTKNCFSSTDFFESWWCCQVAGIGEDNYCLSMNGVENESLPKNFEGKTSKIIWKDAINRDWTSRFALSIRPFFPT